MKSNRTNQMNNTKIGNWRNTKRSQILNNNSPMKVMKYKSTESILFMKKLMISRKHESKEKTIRIS